MRDNRQNQIVMLGVHLLKPRSASLPELGELFQSLLIGLRQWCQNAPAIVKKLCKSRVRTGIFCSRQWLAGNEMDVVGPFGLHLGDYRSLAGADISHNCPW